MYSRVPSNVTEDQSAQLLVVTRDLDMAGLAAIESVWMHVHDLGRSCPKFSRLTGWSGEPLGTIGPLGSQSSLSVRIPADRTLLISTYQYDLVLGGTRKCEMALVWEPVAARDYELRYMYRSGRCWAKIRDTGTDELMTLGRPPDCEDPNEE